jgi:hypothetical protein
VTGHLVAIDDAAEFAERTLGLLADAAKMNAMAAAARRDALERFGLRRHAAAIMGVYDAMLAPDAARQDEGAVEPPRRTGAPADAGPAPRSIELTR